MNLDWNRKDEWPLYCAFHVLISSKNMCKRILRERIKEKQGVADRLNWEHEWLTRNTKNKLDSGTMALISNLFSHPSFMEGEIPAIIAVNELNPTTNNSNYDKLIRRLSSTPCAYPLVRCFLVWFIPDQFSFPQLFSHFFPSRQSHIQEQESPPAWTQEAYRPQEGARCWPPLLTDPPPPGWTDPPRQLDLTPPPAAGPDPPPRSWTWPPPRQLDLIPPGSWTWPPLPAAGPDPPPPCDRQTDTCQNITFVVLRTAGGNNNILFRSIT